MTIDELKHKCTEADWNTEAVVDFMSDFLKNITHYNPKCKNGIIKYSTEKSDYFISPFNEENLEGDKEKNQKLVIF